LDKLGLPQNVSKDLEYIGSHGIAVTKIAVAFFINKKRSG
jgi:hypothetical protein